MLIFIQYQLVELKRIRNEQLLVFVYPSNWTDIIWNEALFAIFFSDDDKMLFQHLWYGFRIHNAARRFPHSRSLSSFWVQNLFIDSLVTLRLVQAIIQVRKRWTSVWKSRKNIINEIFSVLSYELSVASWYKSLNIVVTMKISVS